MKANHYFKFATLILLHISLFCTSCAKNQKKFDYGTVKGSIYSNDYFGLTFPLPDHWWFVDKNGSSEIVKQNLSNFNNLGKDHVNQNERIKELSTPLIFIFKYKPDTITEVNPNLTIVATNITSTPKLKNIDYAIEISQIGIKEMNSVFVIDPTIIQSTIAGVLFKGFKMSATINGQTAKYDSYISNFGDYNLSIIISYSNENEKSELYSILGTISSK